MHPELYEKRRENADRRYLENKKITSLTEEQHDVLADLCTIRHDIHCSWRSMYLSESGCNLYSQLMELVEEIKNINLGKISIPEPENIPGDEDRYIGLIEDTDEAEDENYEKFCDIMEEINTKIEEFLRKIDNNHGTNYAPTGAHRIW